MEENSQEKRRFIRLDVDSEAHIKVKKANGTIDSSKGTLAFVKNISLEGLCFVYSESLALYSDVEMDVYLEDDLRPIHVSGQVQRLKDIRDDEHEGFKFEIGLKILKINREDENKFMDYVWKRRKTL